MNTKYSPVLIAATLAFAGCGSETDNIVIDDEITIDASCLAILPEGGTFPEDLQDHEAIPAPCYDNGLRSGKWAFAFPDGSVEIGPMVAGKRNGMWETQYIDGTVATGPAVDGKQHGAWQIRYADGKTECWIMEYDERISMQEGRCP